VSSGIVKQEEKIKYQSILDKISQFNEKFQGTSLDGDAFDCFIRDKRIITRIYSSVFSGNDISKNFGTKYIDDIADEAIRFVNDRHEENHRKTITDSENYYKYFRELRNILVEKRQSIQSLSQQAGVAQIIESINELKNYDEDNTFAESSIQEVVVLQDQCMFKESISFTDKILSEKQTLSNWQQERLLFTKCIAYRKLNDDANLTNCLRKLHRLNPDSILITDFEFIRILGVQDLPRFKKIKEKYIEQKLEAGIIILKEVEYLVSLRKLDDAKRLLLDNEELIPSFYDNHKVRFFLGVIFEDEGQHEKALEEFRVAYALRKKGIYKLNLLLLQSHFELNSITLSFDIEEKHKDYLLDLIESLREQGNIVSFQNSDIRTGYWTVFLNLLLICKKELFLKTYNELPFECQNADSIQSVLAAYYKSIQNNNDARKILERIWECSELNTFNYFSILMLDKNWSRIEEICNTVGIQLVEKSPIQVSFYYRALGKIYGYERIKPQILGVVDKYVNSIGLIQNFLDIVLENGDSETAEKIVEIIYSNSSIYLPQQIILISRIPSKYQEYRIVLRLLSRFLDSSEKCLHLFIQALYLSKSDEFQSFYLETLMGIYSVGNYDKELLYFLAYQHQKKRHFSVSREIINQYINTHGLDENSASIDLANKVNMSDLSNTEEEIQILELSSNPKNVLLVAILRAKEGNFIEAQQIALKSLMMTKDNTDEIFLQDILINVYFTNFTQHSQYVNFQRAEDNTVVTISSGFKIRKIAIHANNLQLFKSGESIFGCEHFKSQDKLSIKLKLQGTLNSKINLGGVEYILTEILNINVYFARYCFQRHGELKPESKVLQHISFEKDKNIEKAMKKIIEPYDNELKRTLDEYNHSDRIGRSLSYMSGHDVHRYIEFVHYLLSPNKQCFYTGECIIYEQPAKYLMTLSSLITINVLKLNDSIIQSNFDVFITKETYDIDMLGARGSIERINSCSLLLYSDENGELKPIHISPTDKENQKVFWANLVDLVDNDKVKIISERKKTVNNYDKYSDYCEDYDLSSIFFCSENSVIMVCDDQFIRDIGKGIFASIKSTNLVGFLCSINKLSKLELYEMQSTLSELLYIQSTNATVLFESLMYIRQEKNQDKRESLKLVVSRILKSIRCAESKELYSNVMFDLYVMLNESSTGTQIMREILQM
jgi:hypothetical protein